MNKNDIRIGLGVTALLFAVHPARAEEFAIGKSGNDAAQMATVESTAEFETFVGRTHKVSGSINFDPAKKTGSGTISIDAPTVDTGIPLRNEHMQSAGWLDTAKYPAITLKTTRVAHSSGDNYRVTGDFTMHGVTHSVTFPAVVRYIPASDITRKNHFAGDVLRVQSSFKVKLSDYGIMIPAPAQGKVADTVTISISAFGTSG